MALTSGTKLGPYEILSPAGAGGMGEVYRARDTRLDRTVAIKILPAHLADQADLRQRLEREAKAVAALSHPNICTLFDVGHQEGTDFLVMEYLEGETLEKRLLRGPLPVEQLLKVALEIADALEKAHRQGIIHRDMKPGNIMLTKAGAKLMDFGLARTAERAPVAEALTELTADGRKLTAEGTILGTFQYMAPEQLEGHEADARTDIFAFGEVLYEMATGKPAFVGRTNASLIAAILSTDPKPLSELAPMSPPTLDRVVRTCLAKDPDERFQTAHDLKLQLAWIAEGGSQAGVPAPLVARRKHRERLAWAAALLVCGALAAAGWLWKRSAWSYDAPIVTSILPPEKGYFAFTGNEGGPVEVSPDGRMLAFLATGADGKMEIWIRDLSQGAARPLPGTEGGKEPFWSPDSRSIGFFAGGKLKRVETGGGPAVTVCDAQNARGGSWSKDGVILFTPNTQSGIQRVADTGGQPEDVTKIDSKLHTTHRWPYFLPDGKHFLYLAANHHSPFGEQNGVYWASLDGKEGRMVVRTVANAAFADGYLLFLRENTLMAQKFDSESGTLKGSPTPVAEGILYDSGVWRGVFSVSQNGVLGYQPGGSTVQGVQLEWRDRSGKQLGNWGGRESYVSPNAGSAAGLGVAFSHDGGRVAALIGDPAADLWVYDLKRGVRTRLTFKPAQMTGPVWSPDDSRIAFAANLAGRWALYTKASNGAGEEELLANIEGALGAPDDWSSNGKHLLFEVLGKETQRDIWLLRFDQDKKAAPLLKTPAAETQARLSPDGQWMAYVSNESGRDEVYVTPFPNVGPKWQISSEGGDLPRWGRDGRELFFLRPDNTVMVAPITETGTNVEVGAVKTLFKLNSPPGIFGSFSLAPEGSRFLATTGTGGGAGASLTLVVNWTAELKKK